MFPPYSNSGCSRQGGTTPNTCAFWQPASSFGGLWSSLGRVSKGGPAGAFPCTCSWLRCPATRYRRFLPFVTALSTRTTRPRVRVFDLSPLGDQECAGALMWVCVTFAYLVPAAGITIQLLSPQGRASQVEAV